MKRPSRSSAGFTLIELLVVIAIIAILASVVSVAASGAINAAKRAKASNTATQISTAIVNYYTEYGVYPVPTGTTSDTTYSDGGGETALMFALCGNINVYNGTQGTSGSVPNTRQIAFLTPKKSEVDTAGVPVNPFTTSAPYAYFSIAIDADYSGILGDSGNPPPDFSNATAGTACPPPGSKLTQGVAVWACCDSKYIQNPSSSTSPQFWVHTY